MPQFKLLFRPAPTLEASATEGLRHLRRHCPSLSSSD